MFVLGFKKFYTTQVIQSLEDSKNLDLSIYDDDILLNKLGSKIKIFFSYNEILDLKVLRNRIFIYIKPGINYLMIVKIRYRSHEYLTIDKQSRFYFKNYKSKTAFSDLNNFIIQRIQQFTIDYYFKWSDIQEIEISFREILYLSNKPQNISKEFRYLMHNKIFLEISKQYSIFNQSLEELTRDVDVIIENGKIVNMNFDLLEEPVDFIKNVENRNKFLKVEDRIDLNENLENTKFGQKIISNTHLIVKTEKVSDREVKKYAFTKDGRLLSSVNDFLLPDGSIKRSWKDNTIILEKDKILFRSKKYLFKPIKLDMFNKNKKITALPENKIGSFDMEVLINGSTSIIYALGFYSYLDSEAKMFYINRDLNSNKNVIDCLNEMFKAKYNGITWYCHNSGRYDSRILLKI